MAWASGLFGLFSCQPYASHMTLVAVPGITPFVGPTGYVFPLSQIAETVRDAGVERIYEKFHAKVMGWDGAILKKAMVVCGGWVMVMSPAGADAGILMVEFAARLEDAAVEDIRVDYGARQGTATLVSESRGRDGNRTAEGHNHPGPLYPDSHESHGEEKSRRGNDLVHEPRERPCPFPRQGNVLASNPSCLKPGRSLQSHLARPDHSPFIPFHHSQPIFPSSPLSLLFPAFANWSHRA